MKLIQKSISESELKSELSFNVILKLILKLRYFESVCMQVYKKLHHAVFFYVLKFLYQLIKAKQERNLTENITKWQKKSEEDLLWFLNRIIINSVILIIFCDCEFITKYLINVMSKFLILMRIINYVII